VVDALGQKFADGVILDFNAKERQQDAPHLLPQHGLRPHQPDRHPGAYIELLYILYTLYMIIIITYNVCNI
jgi:hypothetical protein